MTPRVVITSCDSGRSVIVYGEDWRHVMDLARAAGLTGNLVGKKNGHWNYDRCVIEGASDLGSVTVDGAP